MTKEELDFLKSLQKELREQSTEGTAAPRFWGIMESGERLTEEGCGDCVKIIDSTHDIRVFNSIEDYAEYIEENFMSDMPADICIKWKHINKVFEEDVLGFARQYLNRIVDTHEYEAYEKISDKTGCFLTKRAAEEHIKKNWYHYSKPRPYCMNAWRNPQFEKFMQIFENLDLDILEKNVIK